MCVSVNVNRKTKEIDGIEHPRNYLSISRSVFSLFYDIKIEYSRYHCLISKIAHHQLIQHLAMNAMIEDDNYQLNEVSQVPVMLLGTVRQLS
jgi:hypothetical protein